MAAATPSAEPLFRPKAPMRHKLLVLALLAFASVAQAAAPNLPYQGRLDQDGRPLTGSYDFRFQLYSTASGGTPVWTGLHPGVTVVAGAFSVKLGSTSVLTDNLLALPQLYLEVSVKKPTDGAYVTLAGRQQLLHVPYAATSASDFRVNGTLLAGQGADGGTAISDGGSAVLAVGPNSNGSSTGGLKVTSPNGGVLVADGRSVETNGTLSLQPVNKQPVSVGGVLNVATSVNAPNTWPKIYDGNPGSDSGAIPIIAGRMYKVFFNGYLFSNAGADARLFLRFNNVGAYKSHITGDADGNFTEWDSTGIYLMRTVYGRTSGASGEFTVSAGGANPTFTHVYGHGMVDDYQFGSGSGIWSWTRCAGWATQSSAPTQMFFQMSSGGSFSGRLIVYQVGP